MSEPGVSVESSRHCVTGSSWARRAGRWERLRLTRSALCREISTPAGAGLRPAVHGRSAAFDKGTRQRGCMWTVGCPSGLLSVPFAGGGIPTSDRKLISGTRSNRHARGTADRPERSRWSLPGIRNTGLSRTGGPQGRAGAVEGSCGCSIPMAGCLAGCGWGSTRGGWR